MEKWIDCKLNLPEQDTHVLVCFDDGFITGADFTDDWELWDDAGDVTHWMPLPAPPKKVGTCKTCSGVGFCSWTKNANFNENDRCRFLRESEGGNENNC